LERELTLINIIVYKTNANIKNCLISIDKH